MVYTSRATPPAGIKNHAMDQEKVKETSWGSSYNTLVRVDLGRRMVDMRCVRGCHKVGVKLRLLGALCRTTTWMVVKIMVSFLVP